MDTVPGAAGWRDDVGVVPEEQLDFLPRVLFVSVNPFSATSNNGKTFASFFAGYPRDAIAQLYFHRELPSSPYCDNYFRFTDGEVLRNVLTPWRVSGERVDSNSQDANAIPASVHRTLRASPTARLLRQVLWCRIRLDSAEFSAWIEEFQPDVIMFCGGDAAYLYRKVKDLADRADARIVLYITDDYVLPRRTKNLAGNILRRWVRREFQSMGAKASLVLTIGELMSTVYQKEFGLKSTPIMNAVDVPVGPPAPALRAEATCPFVFLYAGSLHSQRWRPISQLIARLKSLNESGQCSSRLIICGSPPEPHVLQVLTQPPHAEFIGLLSPAELREQTRRADALVHVESDAPEAIAATRLSLSTKIPEYLISGRPVLAIGPPAIASIRYLAETGAARIVGNNDVAALDAAILSLVNDPQESAILVDRAFRLASENHDGARVRRTLWRRLQEL